MRRKHSQSRSQQLAVAPGETGDNGHRAKDAKRRLVAKLGDSAYAAGGGGPPVERRGRGNREVGTLDQVEAALGLCSG